MHCDALSFFELGSVHYDYYLVNFRIPIHETTEMNLHLGAIKEATLAVSLILTLRLGSWG